MIDFLKKVAGAITGFFVGAGGGMIHGGHYYAHPEHGFHPISMAMGAVVGGVWGAMKYSVLGASYGFKTGVEEASRFPQHIYDHYFSRLNRNKNLNQYILSLSKKNTEPSLSLLSAEEMLQFEAHLNHISDGTLKQKLTADYINYQKYLQTSCPLTAKSIADHQDPIEIEVNDPATDEPSIKIYHRPSLLNQLKRNIFFDYPTIEKETGIELRPENIHHVGFSFRIVDFVNTVRARLNAINALLSADKSLLDDYGFAKRPTQQNISYADKVEQKPPQVEKPKTQSAVEIPPRVMNEATYEGQKHAFWSQAEKDEKPAQQVQSFLTFKR